MFSTIKKAPLNAGVESNSITISGLSGPAQAILSPANTVTTLANAVLLKNGVPTSSPTTVVNGDTLAISGNAASTHSAVSYASLLVEGKFLAYFGVMTVQPDSDRIWTSLDPTANYNYTPISPNHTLQRMDDSGSVTIDLSNSASFEDTDYLIIARYLENMLLFHRTDTGTTHSKSVIRPWALTYSPTETPTLNKNTHVVVARHADGAQVNSVVVFSGVTGNELVSYNCPNNAKPMAVAGVKTTDDNKFRFWVACFDGNVYLLEVDVPGQTITTIHTVNLGSTYRPNHITVDASNNAYVSAPDVGGFHRVVVISYVDGTTSNIAVTGIPRQSTFLNNDLYVCLQDKSQLARIVGTTPSYLSCITNPTHIVATPDSKLHVGSSGVGRLTTYTVAGGVLTGPILRPNPSSRDLGLVAELSGNGIYVVRGYADAPLLEEFVDRAPDSIPDMTQDLVTSGLNTTTTMTISGQAAQSNISFPTGLAGGVSKNGASYAGTISMDNGDTVRFLFQNSAFNVTMYLPILWDNGSAMWQLDYVPPTSGGGGNATFARVAGRLKG